MGIASRTLRKHGLTDQAKEMCDRIYESDSYDKALCIIGEYVNITSVDDGEGEGEGIGSGLSPDDEEGVGELCAFWHKHSLIFGISIHNSQIERMNELTEALKSAVAKRDGAEFQEYRSLLTELLEELQKNEEISFQSII